MKETWKKWKMPLLFTAGGALIGLAYASFIGCATGSCPLTSNPLSAMLYFGMLGCLTSLLLRKEDKDQCNM